MRKAFIVRIVSNRPQAVQVPVRPFKTDKRGVHLLACCRGLLESRLLKGEYWNRSAASRMLDLIEAEAGHTRHLVRFVHV